MKSEAGRISTPMSSTSQLLNSMMYKQGESPIKMICKICTNIAFSPITCKSCKGIFCITCIKKASVYKNSCPSCHTEFQFGDEAEKNLNLNNWNLKKCKFFREGCSRQLGENMIKIHEMHCDYQPFRCPNKNCKAENLKQKDAAIHRFECEYSFIKCEGCNQKIKLKDYQIHSKRCGSPFKTQNIISLKNLKPKSKIKLAKLEICPYCKKKKNADHFKKCNDCQKVCCNYCIIECSICKKFMCPNCSQKCTHQESSIILTLKIRFNKPAPRIYLSNTFKDLNKASQIKIPSDQQIVTSREVDLNKSQIKYSQVDNFINYIEGCEISTMIR